MLLQTLQIEGFRSLKSVTWKPGRLNVLIGPNGGGKSNLLRALDLIRIAATGGLREAIIRRMGGMDVLVWDGEARTICFGADLVLPNNTGSYQLRFNLERVADTGSYEIGMDTISKYIGAREAYRFDRPVRDSSWTDQMAKNMLGGANPAATEVILSERARMFPDDMSDLQGTIRNWSIYNDIRTDQDAEIRRATVTRFEKRVEPDGQNLVAVLHTLYTGDRQFEEFLDNAMAAAFPDDYEKLNFPPSEDGRVQMRVRRKHRKKADSAADLSDGTLRFLLLATILGSPDPAPLIAIDEPEAGLHPRMLPIIGAIAENAAAKSQVIFTTQSPQFLDAFRDELPTVTVVNSNGSDTELKTLAGDDLKRWVEDYSLGKFAFSGEAELAS